MKEGDGIGFDPVGGARQQQTKQLRLMELVEQIGRQPARALDLVRGGADGSPDGLRAGDHGLISRKVGKSRDHRIQRYACRTVGVAVDKSSPSANSLSICSIDLPRVSIPRK